MKTYLKSRTKTEVLVVVFTLIAIWTLAFFNFRISQVKARDIQRKNDLKHVRAALHEYQKHNELYPLGENGKIVGCGVAETLQICEWGEGVIYNKLKSPPEPIINPLPRDPQAGTFGRTYVYESDGKGFRLYAHLEQKNEIEYNRDVEKLGKLCGKEVCNFGITSSSDTSLLEEL